MANRGSILCIQRWIVIHHEHEVSSYDSLLVLLLIRMSELLVFLNQGVRH